MQRTIATYTFIFIMIIIPFNKGWCSKYIAYSLTEAQKELKSSSIRNKELFELGGITHLAGMIFDRKNNDWIIVGQSFNDYPPITIDDLVVVMRAVFLEQKLPLVSIDGTEETEKTKLQKVRYEGGIEHSQIGKDMVDADILLKRIALEKIKTEIWGTPSYVSLREKLLKSKNGDRVSSRFWFKNLKPSLAIREDVFVLMELELGIDTEVLYAYRNGRSIDNTNDFIDEAGNIFAQQLMLNINDLSDIYPVLKRPMPVLALVSLLDVMYRHEHHPDLRYLMHEYNVHKVKTPKHFKLIEVNNKINIDGKDFIHRISGGLEINPIIVRLKKGYPTAFRDVVLNSRPTKDAILWYPPLQGWPTPGTEDIEDVDKIPSNINAQSGFSVDSSIFTQKQVLNSPISISSNYIVPDFTSSIAQSKVW